MINKVLIVKILAIRHTINICKWDVTTGIR